MPKIASRNFVDKIARFKGYVLNGFSNSTLFVTEKNLLIVTVNSIEVPGITNTK